MYAHSTGSFPITGSEFTMLRDTLKKWCGERRINIADPEAERAAAELVDWYQLGMRHPDQLIELLRHR